MQLAPDLIVPEKKNTKYVWYILGIDFMPIEFVETKTLDDLDDNLKTPADQIHYIRLYEVSEKYKPTLSKLPTHVLINTWSKE